MTNSNAILNLEVIRNTAAELKVLIEEQTRNGGKTVPTWVGTELVRAKQCLANAVKELTGEDVDPLHTVR